MYRWEITKDHISKPYPPYGGESTIGRWGPSSADSSLKANPVHFSLYDDDNICYAEGMLYTTDDAYEVHDPEEVDFSPLNNFGAPMWGCTSIKHNGRWV